MELPVFLGLVVPSRYLSQCIGRPNASGFRGAASSRKEKPQYIDGAKGLSNQEK
jgi:hypothetical protein